MAAGPITIIVESVAESVSIGSCGIVQSALSIWMHTRRVSRISRNPATASAGIVAVITIVLALSFCAIVPFCSSATGDPIAPLSGAVSWPFGRKVSGHLASLDCDARTIDLPTTHVQGRLRRLSDRRHDDPRPSISLHTAVPATRCEMNALHLTVPVEDVAEMGLADVACEVVDS